MLVTSIKDALNSHIGRGTTPLTKRLLAIVANYLLTGALPLRKFKEQIHVPRPMMIQVSASFLRQISGGACSRVVATSGCIWVKLMRNLMVLDDFSIVSRIYLRCIL